MKAREIKFRAWLAITNNMVFMKDNQPLWEFLRSIDGSELMQFTGLKDKNGNDIYEGDICFGIIAEQDAETGVLYDSVFNDEGIIEYKDCCFWLVDMPLMSFNYLDIEVIGNIHENKDLLE